ncbi:MAG TPA: hypothetical protein VL400_18640, partial [Polyangiaceae bacterium]|nr:hypothetical protein [Polyangiaceae bacterium]
MLARRLPSVAPVDALVASRESGLARLVSALDGTSGPVAIVKTEPLAIAAVAGHAKRWLTQVGACALVVQSGGSIEPWREAARRLALRGSSSARRGLEAATSK